VKSSMIRQALKGMNKIVENQTNMKHNRWRETLRLHRGQTEESARGVTFDCLNVAACVGFQPFVLGWQLG
jgi:hypothetical protein